MSSEHEEHHQLDDHHQDYYDILANQKLSMQDLMDHMTGPVISAVVHILLISFLSSVIVIEGSQEQNDIEIEMKDMDIKPMEEPPEPPEPPEEVESDEVEVEIDREVTQMEEAEAPVAEVEINDSALEIDVADLMGGSMLGNSSALKMNLGLKSTNFLGNRKSGGTAPPKLKECVAKGLKWLATRQIKEDKNKGGKGMGLKGSFQLGPHPNAKWGACTLAFLGSGNSTTEGEYKTVVRDSIYKMLEKQGKNGSIGMHAHATPFIALALLDCAALEPKNSKVKEGAQKILNYALETQQNNGCWSGSGHANSKSTTDVDLTATGWWSMALISGRLAGLDVPESKLKTLKSTLEKIAKGTFNGKVLVSTHGGTSDSYVRDVTINSTLLTILQFLGTPAEDPLIQELAGKLHGSRKNFKKLNYWTMYKQGVGVFQLGQTSPFWFGFVVDVITKLTESQKPDGSWSCAAGYTNKHKPKSENGGSTQYWGDEGATAMAILNLQVYFRYGSIHEMYKRYGRLIPQKPGKKSSSRMATKVRDDAEDLGIDF